MMDLDDLQRLWEEQNRKLDASLRLNTQILNQSLLGKAEAVTRKLSWRMLLGTPFMLLVMLGSLRFMSWHTTEPQFLIPAVALFVCSFLFVAGDILQVIALRSINYSAPVVVIQKRLGTIWVRQVRIEKWTLLTGPLFWFLLLIIFLKGRYGVNIHEVFGDTWVLSNVLFGVLVILISAWTSKRFARRMAHSPYIQRLKRSLAGDDLNAALGFVGSVERFEKEESPA